MNRRWTLVPSPVGPLLVVADDVGVARIDLLDAEPDEPPSGLRDDAGLAFATEQLSAYFAGSLTRFDLPLSLHGTPFQVAVWRALDAIGYGETTTYGELAAVLGRPDACRAVGAANGRNPVPIVLPCHRVIGRDGTLTGYGGGLPRKRYLLELEARVSLEQALRG